MNDIEKVSKGLLILTKNGAKDIYCDYDGVICAGTNIRPHSLSKEDTNEMENSGWYWSEYPINAELSCWKFDTR